MSGHSESYTHSAVPEAQRNYALRKLWFPEGMKISEVPKYPNLEADVNMAANHAYRPLGEASKMLAGGLLCLVGVGVLASAHNSINPAPYVSRHEVMPSPVAAAGIAWPSGGPLVAAVAAAGEEE